MTTQPGPPRPGRPVRGSTSGRPLMAALDLLGRRWSLRVLWELRAGPLTSRGLREACGGISPGVLQQRLDELREAGLVELPGRQGYALTPLGRELETAMRPLIAWADRWARANP
ncbi:MAG: helix-turn-helix transcriptional regulator [Alphaproteobacteria bacterium]|nr:helix-turn-helix transcriptional regulator [Alphaproteobacteria bacterium]